MIDAEVPVEKVHEGVADMIEPGTTALEKFFNSHTVANASEWLFHQGRGSMVGLRWVTQALVTRNMVDAGLTPRGAPGNRGHGGRRMRARNQPH